MSAPVSDAYTRFVHRVWDRLELLTGHAPSYLDASRIASYCPLCGDGTMLVRFRERPRPTMFISSEPRSDFIAWGEPADPFLATELARMLEFDAPRRCSNGCGQDEIAEVIFA